MKILGAGAVENVEGVDVVEEGMMVEVMVEVAEAVADVVVVEVVVVEEMGAVEDVEGVDVVEEGVDVVEEGEDVEGAVADVVEGVKEFNVRTKFIVNKFSINYLHNSDFIVICMTINRSYVMKNITELKIQALHKNANSNNTEWTIYLQLFLVVICSFTLHLPYYFFDKIDKPTCNDKTTVFENHSKCRI